MTTTMILKNKAASFLILAGSILTFSSQALAEGSAWVGGMYGISVPNHSNTTSRPMAGITGGAKLGSDYAIGAYYLSSTKDEDTATAKSAFNYDLYGAEFTYHFEGEAAGVFFGGRIGTSKVTKGIVTTSPYNIGAVVGFDRMLGKTFSIGGDFSWMNVASSNGTGSGQTTSTDISGFNMLNFMATLKIWF